MNNTYQSTSNQYMIDYINEQLITATGNERIILEQKLKEFMDENAKIEYEMEQERIKQLDSLNEVKENEEYKQQLSKYL